MSLAPVTLLPDGEAVLRPNGRAEPWVPSGRDLIHGDCLRLAGTLLSAYESQIKLIYLDPPFNSGRDYVYVTPAEGGETAGVAESELCFADRWGEGEESFAHFLWQRLVLARRLLSADGTIFLHGTDREAPLLRALMDDVFGADTYLNQIVWHYTGGGRAVSRFSNKHDVIFWYRVGDTHTFDPDAIRVPYAEGSGYARSGIVAKSGRRYTPHAGGTVPDDVWDIPMVNPMDRERTGYPTQKPVGLLERIVLAASRPGDVVADLFAGSGTTLVAAERHGRKWLGVDQSDAAMRVMARRLGVGGWLGS